MEQLDLFGFGEDFDLGFGALKEPEKPAKKASENKAEKNAAKKAASTGKKKSDKDFDVTLPVTVKSRGYKTVLQGFGFKKVSEIFSELREEMPELALEGISAAYDSSAGVLYITDNCIFTNEDAMVDMSKSLVIADGAVKCELTLEDFPGKEAGEVSVEHLLEKWVEVNPLYNGCRLTFAEGENSVVAHPTFSVILPATDKLNVPAQVLVDGDWHTIDDSFADKTVDDLIKHFCGDGFDELTIGAYANIDKSAYFINYRQKKTSSVAKGSKTLTSSTKKVETKYALPLKVYIATWNGTYELTSNDFEGKEKVTLDEIKAYFTPKYKIFSDKSRKLDTIYLEEERTLSIMFVSGTKGADGVRVKYSSDNSGQYELLRSLSELKEAISRPFFHGTLVSSVDTPEGSVRVESFPVGTFLLTQNSESGMVESLNYELKLPKIPMSVLNTVIAYFKQDLGVEACVKLCFNKASQEYFIVKGDGVASKAAISYLLPSDELLANRNVLQVMDIHSHNTMPAYFSTTDNMDECYPGLFGVIGRLDRDVPEIRLRAGYEGIFKMLSLSDLFEVDDTTAAIVANNERGYAYGNV